MPEIRTTIDIDAAPGRVWEILCDTRAYDEWNPFITRFSGDLVPGAAIKFMGPFAGRDVPIDAIVLAVEPERELRWRGPKSSVLQKLFCGEHYFEVEALGNKKTRLVHGETFSGVASALFWSRLEPKLLPLYEGMNQGLKRRAEAD